MYEIVIVLLLLVSVAIVALILVQQGKGAGMGASFGAGASATVFGAAGSGNFLTRSTWFLAVVFFGLCLLIGYLQKQDTTPAGNFTNIEETAPVETMAPAPEDVPSLDSDVPSLAAPEMSSTDAPVLDSATPAPVDSEVPTVDDSAATDAAAATTDESTAAETAAAETDSAAADEAIAAEDTAAEEHNTNVTISAGSANDTEEAATEDEAAQ